MIILSMALAAAVWGTPGAPHVGDTVPHATAHRLVHDSAGNRILLFSGLRSGASGAARYRTALWVADTSWRQLADGGPWGRDDAQLVHDGGRGRLVLFGGRQVLPDRTVRVLTDTWEWDGNVWARVDSAGPSRRTHAGMAYDPVRGVTVLFGGFGAGDSVLGDTWEWNGKRWVERSGQAPSGRWVNGLVYDPTVRAVVLHAADKGRYDRATGTAPGELYRLDDAGWVKFADAPALSPQQPVVATRDGLVWFNGWQADTPSETWIRRDAQWSRVTGPQPERRRGAAMTYDSNRGVVILIGGESDTQVFHDRWEFDGARWSRR